MWIRVIPSWQRFRLFLSMVVVAAIPPGCSLIPQCDSGILGHSCLDFTDQTAGTQFDTGDVITASGTDIEVGPFQWGNAAWTSSGSAEIDAENHAGGSGTDLRVKNSNLDFKLAYPADSITLRFGEFGGNNNLTVNGTFRNVRDLIDLNATVVGGAQIAVSATQTGPNWQGSLTIEGPITDFSMGGQELWIDDVCVVTSCTPGTWRIETVGSADWGATTLALNASDSVHFAYVANANLVYARRGRSGWSMQTVAAGAPGGVRTADLDPAGGVHLGYLDGASVGYAHRDPDGTWSLESVAAVYPGFTSLARDEAGGVHAAWIEFAGRHLQYAFRAAGGGWALETADDTNSVAGGTSLALGPTGEPHVSYVTGANSTIRYAQRGADDIWRLESIEFAEGAPAGTSIGVDGSGGVHLVYNHRTLGLRYAYRAPTGGWTLETADPAGRGAELAIAVDSAGGVHVAYHKGYPDGDLRYAYRSPAGSWSTQLVDSNGWAGRFASLHVGHSGGIHVSYFADDEIRYAYRCP